MPQLRYSEIMADVISNLISDYSKSDPRYASFLHWTLRKRLNLPGKIDEIGAIDFVWIPKPAWAELRQYHDSLWRELKKKSYDLLSKTFEESKNVPKPPDSIWMAIFNLEKLEMLEKEYAETLEQLENKVFKEFMIENILPFYEHEVSIKLQEILESIDTAIDFDAIDPLDFEKYLSKILKKAGAKTKTTKKSGDFGVDILAEKGNVSIAVQVKRYNQKVGVSAVQEAYSGAKYYKSHKAAVVSNNGFTASAARLANELGVALVDVEKRNLENDAVSFLNDLMAFDLE